MKRNLLSGPGNVRIILSGTWIFQDMTWQGIQQIIKYLISDMTIDGITQSLKSKIVGELTEDWLNHDAQNTRIALGLASKSNKNGWFKRIDHGEVIGRIFYQNIDKIKETKLYSLLNGLSNWVDNDEN